MINEFTFQVQVLSDEELLKIVETPDKHQGELIQAVVLEIKNRNIATEEVENPEEISSGTKKINYAGFWVRLLAYTLDALILIIPIIIFQVAIFGDIPKDRFQNTITSFIIWLLYRTITESSEKQGTFGKRIVGIKVIDKEGNRISHKTAAIRYLSILISILPLGLGILAIFTNEKKQTWHDMITECYVIYK